MIMGEKNVSSQPFFYVLCIAVVLVALSFINIEFGLPGFQVKNVEPFSDILLKGAVKNVPLPEPIINDSILAKENEYFEVKEIGRQDIIDFISDSTTSLSHFFQALRATEEGKHKTRIAYFGDSMIEGDLISQDLRSHMQDMFGGNGVGFVPVTSIVASFRTTIKHSFSGWKTCNLLETSPGKYALGISGYSFLPDTVSVLDTTLSSGSWVKYATTSKKHLDKFYEMKLLYGNSTGRNDVVINGRRYRLNGTNKVNQLYIDACRDSASINAQFQCTSSVPIYGFSFESNNGVFVDNFSFRGNSGLPIVKVNKEIYEATDQCLKYDLIVLEYGLNALSPTMTDYSWYKKGMDNVIKHIKRSFPNTSILLISVGDKSYKKDGVFQTEPGVTFMVDIQKQLAESNQIAFWSLYDAMGGNGSMVKWVEGDTVYANKDYTHFNLAGAHKVGKMLFEKLVLEYRNYYKQVDKNQIN